MNLADKIHAVTLGHSHDDVLEALTTVAMKISKQSGKEFLADKLDAACVGHHPTLACVMLAASAMMHVESLSQPMQNAMLLAVKDMFDNPVK